MYAVVIPFLLAANVSVNDPASTWTNGAVYRYRGRFALDVLDETSKEFQGNVTFALECRNKGASSLVCRLSDVVACAPGVVDESPPEEVTTSFRINFDRRGVESLTVSPSPRSWQDNLRNLVELFHVGTDLTARNGSANGNFTVRENSTIGLVDTTYTVVTDEPTDATVERRDFDLTMLPIPPRDYRTSVEIRKARDATSSDEINEFLEANNNDRQRISLTAYELSMELRNGGFFETRSSIRVEYLRMLDDRKARTTLEKVASLTLDSIRQAYGDVPDIVNGTTIYLKTYANFVDNYLGSLP